ncbi:hypothetical protein N7510_002475 [Penicillium lagena]|uniref:uncharacterized protein n=1 Tax=Penicillium lagena TaxID=94218 RepID=UPI002540EFED|nr:uncharacterized protein N7510_002475 [Penicillium lagena]KAJ5626166.1 hypothetical protein N7510_002475 [Penicillium lagena]
MHSFVQSGILSLLLCYRGLLWPYDFDTNGDFRPGRVPVGDAVAVENAVCIVIWDGYYALVGKSDHARLVGKKPAQKLRRHRFTNAADDNSDDDHSDDSSDANEEPLSTKERSSARSKSGGQNSVDYTVLSHLESSLTTRSSNTL